jgi:hypothetical protein
MICFEKKVLKSHVQILYKSCAFMNLLSRPLLRGVPEGDKGRSRSDAEDCNQAAGRRGMLAVDCNLRRKIASCSIYV